jgi:hypothetical protein
MVKSNGSVTITFRDLANPADPSQVVSGVAHFNCQTKARSCDATCLRFLEGSPSLAHCQQHKRDCAPDPSICLHTARGRA